ncbi:polysaccharide pyruvyl transferase family protein [Priestia megaterium]|uniref:polysaccharide pyruvyl transferase family protein n=1 Tax=Priestia megaterium TaxID=1404 RepID=UPI0038A4A73A
MKKILLIGYYGVNNIGDDFFLSKIIKNLTEKGYRKNDIYVFTTDKILIEEKYGIKTLVNKPKFKIGLFNFIYSLFKYINAFKKVDLVLYGGGTQIQEFGKNSYKPLIFKVLYLLVNRLVYKNPVIHFAVGIDQMKTPIGKISTKLIYKLSDKFILRDIYSNNYLNQVTNSDKDNKLILSTDLAFDKELQNVGMNNPIEPLALKLQSNKKINICIAMFPVFFKQYHSKEKQQKFDRELIDLINYLNETGRYNVNLIGFQEGYGNGDSNYMSDVFDCLKNKENVVIHPYNNNYHEVIQFIYQMDICIGMRLHFIIFSLLMNKPTIALNYHCKIDQIMKTLRLENLIVDINEWDHKEIIDKIVDIKEDNAQIKENIKQSVEKEILKSDRLFDDLIKIIEGA